jgi:hypothetical protein
MDKSFNVLARRLTELIDQLKRTEGCEKRKEILLRMRLVMAEVEEILGLKVRRPEQCAGRSAFQLVQ